MWKHGYLCLFYITSVDPGKRGPSIHPARAGKSTTMHCLSWRARERARIPRVSCPVVQGPSPRHVVAYWAKIFVTYLQGLLLILLLFYYYCTLFTENSLT